MDLKEVGNLDQDKEYSHWWIATRFRYIDRAIKLSPRRPLNVLEVGCGTGQNLRYLQSTHTSRIDGMTGVDLNLPANFRPAWSTRNVHWQNNMPSEKKFDLILAMDVLEHIADDQAALQEWSSLLKPDGKILITVPAFQSLWSYHDILLEHERRYQKEELKVLADNTNLKSVFLSYAFSPFFPLVYLLRKLRGLGTPPKHTDLVLPWAPLNFLLKKIGVIEAYLGGNPCFGTSVIGIFSK